MVHLFNPSIFRNIFCLLSFLTFFIEADCTVLYNEPFPGEHPTASGTLAVRRDPEMSKLVGLDFEVFGRVQGVFFRKYTKKRAEELGLKGWCMNTSRDTVLGRIEGESAKVNEMKHWLRNTGSPQSAIDKAEFRNEKDIADVEFANFSIKK